MIAEGDLGLGEQIAGLRTLADGFEALVGAAESNAQAVQLADLYTQTASRRADLIEAEKRLSDKGKESRWAEEFLEGLDQYYVARGMEPCSEAVRRGALGDPAQDGPDRDPRNLTVEIARTRLILRNLLELAMEALEEADPGEYIKLVGYYGIDCTRLARMLRVQGAQGGKLEEYIKRTIDETIVAIRAELEEAGDYDEEEDLLS